jgi:hypothetical protein
MLLGKQRRDPSSSHPSLVRLKRNQVQRLFLSSVSNLLSLMQLLERSVALFSDYLAKKKFKKRLQELIGNNVEGVLALKNPWPSIARSIYQDHKRYLETYMKVI